VAIAQVEPCEGAVDGDLAIQRDLPVLIGGSGVLALLVKLIAELERGRAGLRARGKGGGEKAEGRRQREGACRFPINPH
jgi:hypothetical protein